MKPAFRYYGGKARIAPWIVAMFPTHVSYVEPFFGAGAVLLNKLPSRHELINDLDGEVVNFYRVLRDDVGALEEACRLTPYSRDEFNFCKAGYGDLDADPVERARRFFTVVGQSFACTTGTASGWGASTNRNVNRSKSTGYYIDRFERLSDRFANVMIENNDAANVIERFAGRDDVVYCDPPYVHSSRGMGGGGGHGYRHEMSEDDHRALSALRGTCYIFDYGRHPRGTRQRV